MHPFTWTNHFFCGFFWCVIYIEITFKILRYSTKEQKNLNVMRMKISGNFDSKTCHVDCNEFNFNAFNHSNLLVIFGQRFPFLKIDLDVSITQLRTECCVRLGSKMSCWHYLCDTTEAIAPSDDAWVNQQDLFGIGRHEIFGGQPRIHVFPAST